MSVDRNDVYLTGKSVACIQHQTSVSSSSTGAERTAAGRTASTSLTGSRSFIEPKYFSCQFHGKKSVMFVFIDLISQPTVASERSINVDTVKLSSIIHTAGHLCDLNRWAD